jgi:hypothetical protein
MSKKLPVAGHAVGAWYPKSKDGRIVEAIGHGCGIEKNHIILIKGPNGGQSPYIVREIEYYLDPSDMWKAQLEYNGDIKEVQMYQQKGFL